jgi:hypothetical protein
MAYPPPSSTPQQPDRDQPSWYTPAPGNRQPSRETPAPPQHDPNAPSNPYAQQPPHQYPAAYPQHVPPEGYVQGYPQPQSHGPGRQPGDPYPPPMPPYGAPADATLKPRSQGLAATGWILTVFFSLVFILFFLGGVSSFNSNVSPEESAAYNIGVFIGLLIILLIPAIPVFVGIRLIRQPKRRRAQPY